MRRGEPHGEAGGVGRKRTPLLDLDCPGFERFGFRQCHG